MVVALGIWLVLVVIGIGLCIWIPNFYIFIIPLAIVFIIAFQVAAYIRQNEQMEALEARLKRIEALLQEQNQGRQGE